MLSLTSDKASPCIEKTELQSWALALKRLGLASFAAAFLESGSAFAALAAQGLYLAEPVLELWSPPGRLHALANLFEDPQQTAAFAQTLREAE